MNYKALDIAEAQIGYLEKSRSAFDRDPMVVYDKVRGAGYDNITKYAYDLDKTDWYGGHKKNGYAWCSAFVDWVFVTAYSYETAWKMLNHCIYSAGVDWAIDDFKKMGRFFYNPKVGDQIFFGTSSYPTHTGLVYAVDDEYVYTFEGNTSSSAGVEPNGGAVCAKKYKHKYGQTAIVGYGRPKYELVERNVDDMTDKEIYEAVMRYATSREIPAGMKAEYDEAIKMGITDGTRPMALCTRIESTLMTKRAIEKK